MTVKDFRTLIETEAKAILNIPVSDRYVQATELIAEQVNQRGGTLITSGMGKAGQIAMNIATTFSSTGTPAFFLHPSEAQHGDLGILRHNDIMLLISNSGKTRELQELVILARRLQPDVRFIVITANADSPLALQADVCLTTGAPDEVCPLGLTPTTSTTVMTVIGDLLVVSVMKKIGFTSADYAKRHHGGYLGEKSREQSEVKKI
jgi:arabinose-5-phosphate isomerase